MHRSVVPRSLRILSSRSHSVFCPTRRSCSQRGHVKRVSNEKILNGSRRTPTLECKHYGTQVTRYADSTIYALSTAPGRAAIAIIRVSGPQCTQIYNTLCPDRNLPKPRTAAVRSLYGCPDSGSANASVLDTNALVLFFPSPRTVTGEDVIEFHVHGGPAIVKAVLSAIRECHHGSKPVRYAEPGEFTRRAFLNNRLNLPQIEALGDTLSAATEEQRRLSVRGTTSGLAIRYESWRQLLLYARGELEALIDFSEDQHFDESPPELASNVAVQIRSLSNKISYHRANATRGELLRNGITISLIGAPNVGKSSLLNLIVGRNAAIVSREAGTTRDIVEVGIDLGGFFCRLGDTAGLRQSGQADASQALASVVGEIEQEGIRRAKERALQSDVVLLVLSIEPSTGNQDARLMLESEVVHTANELMSAGKYLIAIVNKMDNLGKTEDTSQEEARRAVETALPDLQQDRIFFLSCKQVEAAAARNSDNDIKDPGSLLAFLDGLSTVFQDLTRALVPDAIGDEQDASPWEESLGATQRQSGLLAECQAHLEEFIAMVSEADQDVRNPESPTPSAAVDLEEDASGDVDIVKAAESLRAAADCLGKITGRGEAGDVEEVLGVVFEKFCVGK